MSATELWASHKHQLARKFAAAMAVVKPPSASLATVAKIVGKSELRIAERLADAGMSVARRYRYAPRRLAAAASLAVASDLEQVVRERCKRAERDWHWFPSHLNRLAKEILAAACDDSWLEHMIDQRCVSAISEMANNMKAPADIILEQIAFLNHREGYAGFIKYIVAASNKLNNRELKFALDTVNACSALCRALLPESIYLTYA